MDGRSRERLRVAAPIRHFRLVFTAELKRLVAYRVQFWCELVLSSLVELLVGCTVWRAVFDAQTGSTVSGYTYPHMVLYVTIAVFVGQAVRGTSVGTFAREIYDGSLTKYLVYPLSIFSYKLGTFSIRGVFALAQLGIALAVLRLANFWPSTVTLSGGNASAALLAVLCAALLYFFLLFCVESAAFWADQVWALSVMLQFITILLSGKWIPLDLFPAPLRTVLTFSPFPYLTFFPVKILMGEVPASEVHTGFIVLSCWLAVIALLARFLYGRGLRQYTGVGI